MDSRLLDYFLRVVELGSINRAASDLHLSQPSLSRHIAALEHEMGTQLFIRNQAGVSLTEAGRLLADRARPLLSQFALLKEQIGHTRGQLAIGIPPSWHNVFTSNYIQHMLTESPGVNLRVHEGVSHVLRDHMLAGLLDLCIVPFTTNPALGYRQTSLVREPLILVGPSKAKLASDEVVQLKRLDGLPLVLPGRPNMIRMLTENSLSRLGMTFKIALQVDTLDLCLDIAERGLAHTVVPACAVAGLKERKRLSWAPVKGFFMTWALNENEARSHSPAVSQGRKTVFTTLKAALDSGNWLGAEGTEKSAH